MFDVVLFIYRCFTSAPISGDRDVRWWQNQSNSWRSACTNIFFFLFHKISMNTGTLSYIYVVLHCSDSYKTKTNLCCTLFFFPSQVSNFIIFWQNIKNCQDGSFQNKSKMMLHFVHSTLHHDRYIFYIFVLQNHSIKHPPKSSSI